MPITEAGAAVIGAGAALFGQGANVYAQGKMNKKTREWNERQYWRTRADSLADWNRQNEYNSPAAQMARFKEAGLNPNLIYGQQNTADAVRSSETPSWNPRAPEINLDATSILNQYFDTQLKNAQIDNFNEAIKTAQQQQANIAADTANKVQQNTTNKWQEANASQLGQVSLDAARAGLRKLETETQISLNQDQRNAALTSSSLKEALARMAKMDIENAKTMADKATAQQLLKNMQSDNQLKQLDIELKKLGIQPNDPAWMRIITQSWEKLKSKIPKFNNKFESFKKF